MVSAGDHLRAALCHVAGLHNHPIERVGALTVYDGFHCALLDVTNAVGSFQRKRFNQLHLAGYDVLSHEPHRRIADNIPQPLRDFLRHRAPLVPLLLLNLQEHAFGYPVGPVVNQQRVIYQPGANLLGARFRTIVGASYYRAALTRYLL